LLGWPVMTLFQLFLFYATETLRIQRYALDAASMMRLCSIVYGIIHTPPKFDDTLVSIPMIFLQKIAAILG
jgi:hypothetical protein